MTGSSPGQHEPQEYGPQEFAPDGSTCRHPPGVPGSFDERARRLSHGEFAVARLLVSEGHDVRSRPEGRRLGRTPDLEVCGRTTEIKTLRPGATSWTMENQLVRAIGQGESVIVDARGSGLKRGHAERSVQRFAGFRSWAGAVTSIRVIGDDYGLFHDRRQLTRLRGAVRRPPGLGLG